MVNINLFGCNFFLFLKKRKNVCVFVMNKFMFVAVDKTRVPICGLLKLVQ